MGGFCGNTPEAVPVLEEASSTCKVWIPQDIQNLRGQRPGHPGGVDSALSKGVRLHGV